MSWIDYLVGKPLESREEHGQKVGVFAGIPMLGLDGLASAAYGPEAALTLLIAIGAAGPGYALPIVLIILAILFVLYVSYRQTIAAYPGGGGSYTVAKENLGVSFGLLAAAALMIDYVLTVAVGISAGVGALVSAVPSLHSHMLAVALLILAVITIVNLRGVKESGIAFAAPTYLFIGSLSYVLLVGVWRAITSGGAPTPIDAPTAIPAATTAASTWLLLRAFASGCTAMTGVEAVSNGVAAFREPTVRNAQKTLTAIVGILAAFLLAIAYLCKVYAITAVDPDSKNYQSVIAQIAAATVGRGFVYYLTIATTLAVLALSANTGFADFPRLCRLVAEDDYLPHAFRNRGRRLVYSQGILILATLSAILLIAFGGVTDRLIPLFAVGAFLAFTLSQAGMVAHWIRLRKPFAAFVNGTGAVCTGVALVIVLLAKFVEGAWIVALLIPAFVATFVRVRRHYVRVARMVKTNACYDSLDARPPLVIVPIKDWTTVSAKAVAFAMTISPDVTAVHVAASDEAADRLHEKWERVWVGRDREPKLTRINSPFRYVFQPFIEFVHAVREANPDRNVAVVIPELVENRWYQYFLHNQQATILKAGLLLRGGKNVVVINVPWYL